MYSTHAHTTHVTSHTHTHEHTHTHTKTHTHTHTQHTHTQHTHTHTHNTTHLELRRAGEDAQQLNLGHRGLQQRVVCGHGLVGAVVVRRNATKVRRLMEKRGSKNVRNKLFTVEPQQRQP